MDEYAYAVSNEYSTILRNHAIEHIVDYLYTVPKDDRKEACEALICELDKLDIIDIDWVEIY